MKQVAVLHPSGHGAWVCSFPETGSEPNVLAHDQFIYDLGQQRDDLLARIEELESQVISKQGAIDILNNMNNELLADNKRLREVLEHYAAEDVRNAKHYPPEFAKEALDATPAQSLARIRNQVREKCCGIVFGQCSSDNEAQRIVNAIRAMKEEE